MSDSQDTTHKVQHTTPPDPLMEIFEPGQMVGGKYKIVSILGVGGMGCVYRAEQIFLQQEFALKTLSSHKGSDILMKRFQIEARAASSLNHPNLVKVTDFGLLDDERPYLVMDFVDGITLSEHLKRHGQLTIDQAAVYFAQACLGLSYAHDQGIVHRDIKPSNLMIAGNLPFGAEGSLKVVDFGIAKLTSAESNEYQALTGTGEIFGSPLYMSPEQASGLPVDHRTDIYSLGCVLFEALTGTAPHVGANALATMMLHQSEPAPSLKEASLGKEFPPALEQLVAKMLSKSPADRYQNLGLVANDLALISKGVMPPAVPKSSQAKAAKTVSLTQTKLYSLLIGLGVLAAIVGGLCGYLIGKGHAAVAGQGDLSQPLAKSLAGSTRPESNANKQDSSEKESDFPSADQADPWIDDRIRQSKDSELKREYYSARLILDKTAPSNRGPVKGVYRRLKNVLKQLKDSPSLEQSYIFGLHERVANCCCRLGKFDEARAHLDECMRIANCPENEQMVADCYLLISQLTFPGFNQKVALSAWLKAASIGEKISREKGASAAAILKARLMEASVYRAIGGYYVGVMHDYDKSIDYNRKAKHILESCGKTNEFDYACTCLGLGSALSRKQQFAEAIPILQKALPIFKRISPLDPNNYRLLSTVYSEIGIIEAAASNKDAARKEFLAAREAVIASGAKTPVEKKYNATTLANLDNLLKGLGN